MCTHKVRIEPARWLQCPYATPECMQIGLLGVYNGSQSCDVLQSDMEACRGDRDAFVSVTALAVPVLTGS